MALINIKEQVILKDLTELKGAIGALQATVETDGGLNAGVKEKFALIQGTIDGIAQAIADPLYVRLKERQNMFTPAINRLPVELLTYIILLANKLFCSLLDTHARTHPFLSYTWVCRHWRSVLIQSPVFWTMIEPRFQQHPISETFDHELLRRTKSAKLCVILSPYRSSPPVCDTFLKDLFKESSRIHSLALVSHQDEVVQLASSAKHFPSLRRLLFVRYNYVVRDCALSQFLPILVASNNLETFECTLPPKGWDGIQNCLAVIFNRLRNLSLRIYSPAVAQSVLDLLFNNNTKLQTLQLITNFADGMGGTYEGTETSFSGQATFPELLSLLLNNSSLLGCFQAPKLLDLNTCWKSDPCTLDCPILNEFNFSSIKYLYIRGWPWRHNARKGYCILGSKDRVLDLTSYTETDAFDSVVLDSHPHPCDYFHLRFGWEQSAFEMALRTALSAIIPQLTSLVELHLLFPQTYSVCREIIPRVPSIQELIVGPGNALMGLLRLLSNPSQCPQLIYLSYTTFPPPKHLTEYADNIGRNLTNCLQSRQNNSPGDMLKYISLLGCPPLPDNWLEELQKLGARVTTEMNNKTQDYDTNVDWIKI